MMNYKKMIIAASALLACCCLTVNAQEKPNIIFVLADDLGYMDLVSYAARVKGVDGLGLGASTSEWVAYLDDNNWGVGIYTPGTTEFTAYRALGDGTTGDKGSACSYVAPLRTFALTKGLVVRYDVYLTIGTLDEIKTRFKKLNEVM